MNTMLKRIGAVLLTIAMLATMIPAMSVAAAGTALDISVEGLTAEWELTTNNNSAPVWTVTSNTLKVEVAGKGKSSVSTLTFTNTFANEATLSFNYAFTTAGTNAANRGSLAGIIAVSNQASANDSYSAILAAGASVSITLTSPRLNNNKATLDITDLNLINMAAADPIVTFPTVENGTYTVDGEAVTDTLERQVAVGTKVSLSAAAADGYQLLGWYNATTAAYLTAEATCQFEVLKDTVVYPVFVPLDTTLFGVGNLKYDDLTQACNAAAALPGEKVVVLLNDGTLSGQHTIPAGVTLLIPYDDANTRHGDTPGCTSVSNDTYKPWEKPTAYRTLTMTAGSSITVDGAIEVGGLHSAAAGALGGIAAPTGSLGYIYMAADSHIEVNSTGSIYSWGYIYGDGTITAKSGAGIYEVFQVMDFRGGEMTLSLVATNQIFPMTQYYVQNVEVATTYESGAVAYVTTSLYVGSQCLTAPPIAFIGEGAMFQPADGSYVVKKYNTTEDILELETYGDCTLSGMAVNMGAGFAVNTSMFTLPINNGIHITINSGVATLNQDVAMLPGSSMTVAEDALLYIPWRDPSTTSAVNSGYQLQLYDMDNWTSGMAAIYMSKDPETNAPSLNVQDWQMTNGLNFLHNSYLFCPVTYAPGRKDEDKRTLADLKDAELNVNGMVYVEGYLYSTVQWQDIMGGDMTVVAGGANVHSSAGTGQMILAQDGQIALGYMYDQEKDTAFKTQPDYNRELAATLCYAIPLSSVQLKNADGTLVDTTGTSGTYVYCTKHGHWVMEECTLVEITWIANGDTIRQLVEMGSLPTYPGTTPAKAYGDNQHYDFAGWAATEDGAVIELPAAAEDVTYYAVFTAVNHTYGTTATDALHACVCGKTVACIDYVGDGNHLCDRGCGATLSQHIGGTAYCDKQAVCDECNQSYGDLLPHTPGNPADCINDQTCVDCGVLIEAAHGHDYYYACDKVCKHCGRTTRPEAKHAYDYDCSTDCSICGQTTRPEAKHAYDYDCSTDCKHCGQTTRPEAKHVYDYDCDPTCNICSGTRDADHQIVHVEAVEAVDCQTMGIREHWYCDYCKVVWSDVTLETTINANAVQLGYGNHQYFMDCEKYCMVCNNLTRPEADHNVLHVAAKAPTCDENGNIEYWYCDVCGTAWLDVDGLRNTDLLAVVLPAAHTNLQHFDAVEAKCHYIGNVEYWHCYDCQRVYQDEDLKQLTNVKNVILPALESTATYVPAQDATCVTLGNVDYWTCDVCQQVWADEALTQLSNRMNVLIGYADHIYTDDNDADCNQDGCDHIRLVDYPVLSFDGNSASQDVMGVGFNFAVSVEGLAMNDDFTAVYDNATITPNSWAVDAKLVRMGAVVSNVKDYTTMEYVNGEHTIDVPAVYLMKLDGNVAEYAVRIVNIPPAKVSAPIYARAYLIYEDSEGVEQIVYGEQMDATFDAIFSGN